MTRTLLFTDYQPTQTTKLFVQTVMDGAKFTIFKAGSNEPQTVFLNKEELLKLAHVIIDTVGDL